jgi:transcriptional regulator with XRE-family HTH domain
MGGTLRRWGVRGNIWTCRIPKNIRAGRPRNLWLVASADPTSEYDAVVALARNREGREGSYPAAPEGLAQTSGEEDTVLRTEPEIGRILEQARDGRGLSLKQVEQATKIRARYLEELERGNFGVLPAVYAKGSLRTYADYVGLDAEALVRELEDQRAFHPAHDPTDDEPPKGSPGIPPILPGIPTEAGGRRKVEDEEEAGPTPIPAGGERRSYLPGAAALLLVFALAGVALALTRVEDDPPVISQVREPVAYPVSPIGEVGGERARQQGPQREDAQRSADDESNGPKPGEYAAPDGGDDEDLGAARTGRAGRPQHGPPRAQNAHGSTATPPSSVPAAAEAALAATETVAAQTPPLATEATPTTAVQSAPTTAAEAVPTTTPPPDATPTPPAPTAAQSVPAPARAPVPGDQDEEVVATKREVIAPTWSGSPTRPTVRSAAATARLADAAADGSAIPSLKGPHSMNPHRFSADARGHGDGRGGSILAPGGR